MVPLHSRTNIAFATTIALTLVVVALVSTSVRAATVVVLPINDDPALTSEVRGALAPYGRVQAAATTAEAMAAARSLGIACTQTAPSCLAQLGGLAGGDLVVGGTVLPMPDGAQIALKLVEVSSGRLVRTADQLVPSSGPGRARALRVLAVRLIAPEKERGSIAVFAPAGAALQLDGDAVGHAPLDKALDVAPGHHEVYAALNGYISASATVDVEIGQNASVNLELLRDADGDGEPDHDGRTARPDGPHIDREGRVGIIAVEGTGFDDKTRGAIAEAIAVELEKLEDTTVVRLEDVQATLSTQTALMLACREAGCHALVAQELALEDLVVVEVNLTAETSSITITRFNGPTGAPIMTSVHDGLAPAGGDEIAAVIGPAVQRTFPRMHIRDGAVRGMDKLVYERRGGRPPLPQWLFWTSLAATGATAATAGGFAAWSAGEQGATKGSLGVVTWVAVGATAALIAADVAVALSTDWSR